MTDKIAILSISGETFEGLEGETARRVMRCLFSRGSGERPDVFEVEGNKPLTVRDVCDYGRYDVYVVVSGTVYITRESINNLTRIALRNRALCLVAPVSNEGKVLVQRGMPPFLYQTMSVFRWAVSELYKERGDEVMEVDEIDDFCFALRRDVLDSLPGDCSIADISQFLKSKGLRFGIARGVYIHRYGNCYESGRDDLMVHVPNDARAVLDIGSARGLFGELLKKRQECIVTGVDYDSELAAVARQRLDEVITGDIEALVDQGALGIYDCVVCGDLLEHLINPWKMVKGLKSHLREGGIFIASTPNVMNWAVILDQFKGRWDYIPFSILSGTHIRFFTKATLEELFTDAGYKIREVLLQSFDIPPRGVEFITALRKENQISEEELRAHEIVIVAER